MYNQYTYRSMGTVNRHMQVLGDKVIDLNNVFTTGYKKKDTSFHETLHGMKPYYRRHHSDGQSKLTSRELDFAIEGKGFFEIQLPDGTNAYTRDGSFTIGPNGELLSSQGYQVVTSNPNSEFVSERYDSYLGSESQQSYDVGVDSSSTYIPIGATVKMDEDGTLRTEDGQIIGKLSVVNFANVDGLKDIGENVYLATESAGDIQEVKLGSMAGETKVRQGYLESSNVSIVKDMADIVQLNTAIKAEMKIIKVLDQMQENLTSTITRNL
jgi:flagellar basal body rod protein FlgG